MMKRRGVVVACLGLVMILGLWLLTSAVPPWWHENCIYNGGVCYGVVYCGPGYGQYCKDEYYCPEYYEESCGWCCGP